MKIQYSLKSKMYLMLVICLSSLVSMAQTIPNDSLLISYFSFNSSPKDSLGFFKQVSLTGTNVPVLTTDKFGKQNKAYSFSGTDGRILTEQFSALNLQTLPGLTFSLWVYPRSYTSNDSRLIQFDISSTPKQFDLSIAGNSRPSNQIGKPWFINTDATTNPHNYPINSQATTIIGLNIWSHIVTKIDYINNTVSLYINGASAGTFSTTTAPLAIPSIAGLCIGNHFYTPFNWGFDGKIDEVRLYGYAMPDSKIQQLFQNYDYSSSICSSTSGLVLYYPFSGNTLDSTANALNGTASGVNLTTDKSSQSNSAYSFPGNSHIKTNHDAKIAPTNGITLSAWVNPSQISNGVNSSTSYRLIDKVSVAGSQGYLLDVLASRTAPTKFRFVGATPTTWQTSNYNVIANTWQHVAVTYDNDSVRFYINGMKDIAIKGTQSLQTNTLPLFIGMDQNGGSTYLGKLDEVKIFDRALNACEIQQIYNAPLPKGPVTTEQEEAITLSNELTVFPNPSQGTFAIRSTSNTIEKLQIISLNGQLVSTAEGTKEVNVANLQPGMYFVKCWMTGSGQALIKKIIVE